MDVAECLVIRPAILAALPDLRRLVTLGGSRTAELTLAVTETPAGLDIAVTGGKPMTPALLADLVREGVLVSHFAPEGSRLENAYLGLHLEGPRTEGDRP